MAHVDHFSQQTDHLKAAVVAGPLRVYFDDESETQTTCEAIQIAEDNEQWLAKPPSPSTDVTWVDPTQLATTPWWDIPIKVIEEDNYYSQQAVINPLDTAPKFVLVILYNDEGIYMSQRINPTKPMYLKYQVVCGKTEPGENGIEAACRKSSWEDCFCFASQENYKEKEI